MPQEHALTGFSTVGKIGRVWFQLRSYSPLPFLFLLILLKPQFVPGISHVLLASFGILGAEALRLWAVGFAGSATRTRGDSVPQLVHAGPYRWVRNPLYLANIIMYTCVGILFGFSSFSILIFLFSTVEYIFIVAFEEETLTRLFGSSYENYCEKVPRWIPSLAPSIETSNHSFDLQRALRSERSTFLSLSGMGLLLIIKKVIG